VDQGLGVKAVDLWIGHGAPCQLQSCQKRLGFFTNGREACCKHIHCHALNGNEWNMHISATDVRQCYSCYSSAAACAVVPPCRHMTTPSVRAHWLPMMQSHPHITVHSHEQASSLGISLAGSGGPGHDLPQPQPPAAHSLAGAGAAPPL
jgi:hypothetical protein